MDIGNQQRVIIVETEQETTAPPDPLEIEAGFEDPAEEELSLPVEVDPATLG